MNLTTPLIVFLFSLVNDYYGFIGNKYECKKVSSITLFTKAFHTLMLVYSIFSPFVLKDYWSNLMYNSTLLLLWFLVSKVNGYPACVLSIIEEKICENDEIKHDKIPPYYPIIVMTIMVYDIYMLLRA
jgi:hypothetical protein